MATQALARSGNSSITGPIAVGSFLRSECSPDPPPTPPPHASFGDFFSRREGGVGVSPLLSLTPPIPSRFEFLPLAFHWLAEQETRPTERGKPGCASPAAASPELEPGEGEGRGSKTGLAWLPLASEDRPVPFKNLTERQTTSLQRAFGVPLTRRLRMVMSLRAGCRAALSLWILSSLICRAWTAPSTFRK